MVEDPVSDTDDPNVKSNSNVVGDQRKHALDIHTLTEIEELPVMKSLQRAIDTKWGRIIHEYELELARTGKQGF
ncbi:hypothetical protein MKW92_012557 [Papaver armeniacum]|nr:hypothetical protein MKW92_012557 [Papaver armeniacum]